MASRPTTEVVGGIARSLPFLKNSGGNKGIRTLDPLLAKQVLSQLSYIPIYNADDCLRGENGRSWTCDLLDVSQMLYQLSYTLIIEKQQSIAFVTFWLWKYSQSLEPNENFEISTCSLQMSCSASELIRHIMVTCAGIEPTLQPWKGRVLTAWLTGHNNREDKDWTCAHPPTPGGALPLRHFSINTWLNPFSTTVQLVWIGCQAPILHFRSHAARSSSFNFADKAIDF